MLFTTALLLSLSAYLAVSSAQAATPVHLQSYGQYSCAGSVKKYGMYAVKQCYTYGEGGAASYKTTGRSGQCKLRNFGSNRCSKVLSEHVLVDGKCLNVGGMTKAQTFKIVC